MCLFTSRYINHMIVFIAISHIISLKQKHLFFFWGGGAFFVKRLPPGCFLAFDFFYQFQSGVAYMKKAFST